MGWFLFGWFGDDGNRCHGWCLLDFDWVGFGFIVIVFVFCICWYKEAPLTFPTVFSKSSLESKYKSEIFFTLEALKRLQIVGSLIPSTSQDLSQ